VAGIRLNPGKSVRPFKGIFCDDIFEFESDHLSQAVVSYQLTFEETAFDEAWITLKSNGSSNIRPNELARRICHLAMEGERDPVRLHDRALGELIPATMWRE
jgi:hypothetical protein